ncbi:MAG TPA: hypothetical protein VH643_31075 [Gemmataceae bacterium]|jgi:hypothetical protein
MVKGKFGDSLRLKTDTAMVNEALAKLLAHNLVVVIHEMYELGIDPTFGTMTLTDEPRDIQLFRRSTRRELITYEFSDWARWIRYYLACNKSGLPKSSERLKFWEPIVSEAELASD